MCSCLAAIETEERKREFEKKEKDLQEKEERLKQKAMEIKNATIEGPRARNLKNLQVAFWRPTGEI